MPTFVWAAQNLLISGYPISRCLEAGTPEDRRPTTVYRVGQCHTVRHLSSHAATLGRAHSDIESMMMAQVHPPIGMGGRPTGVCAHTKRTIPVVDGRERPNRVCAKGLGRLSPWPGPSVSSGKGAESPMQIMLPRYNGQACSGGPRFALGTPHGRGRAADRSTSLRQCGALGGPVGEWWPCPGQLPSASQLGRLAPPQLP